ncbi:chaperonin Cpn10 [Pirellula staleyi DSM 6068]|uniref:Co-chaperonin GroES n=1 Tax=Pirellula staleyi (strain ATCC 27377 / DSM 6068 / ICPB 4128) TaxID=530564 RepID=D2R7D5_PIRSD|nr:co-chaperone GroES [Pirellula staleyi]ADB15631.1 chaperonin Cpn10 [Pirellula staleyi DSM 6068]
MRVVPIGDKVVVKRMTREEKTSGGIVLPGAAQEKSQEGRVLSVGDGRLLADGTRAAVQVSEGDRVVLSPWAGTEIKVADEELLIVSEEDILAVLD